MKLVVACGRIVQALPYRADLSVAHRCQIALRLASELRATPTPALLKRHNGYSTIAPADPPAVN
ncbi:uncharacterized protein N7518_002639 [Penicillium psychrosexuale]|uniref:uncharacterized protein n=1 Tax=Penicillium psychrosexuale TaxID=1002107 RepID=UPI00254508B6|nr:uncharacterized protein N7518_002639 [Penicillium psychrosexuale]KAJ5800571.1 hypothetical protein N7518_002639 [Penicillium psychrosexuale]